MAGPNGDSVPDGTRIGAQLRAARLAARMSMAEVAEQAGLTKGFVSKLERDLANVSVASLIRLCDALASRSARCSRRPRARWSGATPGRGSTSAAGR
jgi:transcriptional regulator with XRE-family HTH domain